MRLPPCCQLIAFFISLPMLPSAPAQEASPRQRVEEIAAASSLIGEGARPWHLRMTFELDDLKGKPKDTGTLEEWWISPRQVKLVVTSADYNRPKIPGTSSTEDARERFLVQRLRDQVIDPTPHYGDFSNLVVTSTAVKHWTYRPYQLNGQPAEVDTNTILVNFNLNSSR